MSVSGQPSQSSLRSGGSNLRQSVSEKRGSAKSHSSSSGSGGVGILEDATRQASDTHDNTIRTCTHYGN